MLLLHGFPQTWYEWRHVLPVLAERYTVIAPDYRGAGNSARPIDGYEKATMAADVVELTDHLVSGARLRVVGHDMGAFVATPSPPIFRTRSAHSAWWNTPVPGTRAWDGMRTAPHQRVLGTEASRAGQSEIGNFAAHPTTSQSSQRGRAPLTVDQRLDHLPGRDGGQRGRNRVDLDAGVFKDHCQALQLAGTRLDELLAIAGQLPDRCDLRRRDEAAPQQAALGQLGQPRRIESVALAAGDLLDVPGARPTTPPAPDRLRTGRGRPASSRSRWLQCSRA